MAIYSRNFNEVDLSDPVKAADYVKRKAMEFGADAVGIGSIDRWNTAPLQMDPKQIMPECKSIVGMLFRVERGSLRGLEEGTYFSNYSSMGYGGITYLYMPMTVINLSKTIEDQGYEAIPMGHQSDWRGIDADGFTPRNYSRPVRPGQATPDIMIQLRIAAFLCGLGEIGFSKMFLSPQFGPRNRIGIVLTDLKLEPDPIYDGPKLCNRCGECIRNCPGQCFDVNNTIKINLAGHEVEWANIDTAKCDITFRGAVLTDEPQDKPYMPERTNSKPGSWSPFYRKPRNLYNTGQAVCGARGCTRACMISLEKRGVLENSFKEKFRRRPPWNVDWDTPPEYSKGTLFRDQQTKVSDVD
ncbi:MAG: hypothetical protein GX561_05790 [Lentisphaerae bacterium]|jgi:epoxyqueuosine reductase|nr:hypothetical protein [Lentisphaerota bacterium]